MKLSRSIEEFLREKDLARGPSKANGHVWENSSKNPMYKNSTNRTCVRCGAEANFSINYQEGKYEWRYRSDANNWRIALTPRVPFCLEAKRMHEALD
ncbi:MAG: hypothetical protein ACXQTI_07410 [Candidatus Nezhaarchaeales archaeon]